MYYSAYCSCSTITTKPFLGYFKIQMRLEIIQQTLEAMKQFLLISRWVWLLSAPLLLRTLSLEYFIASIRCLHFGSQI